MVIYLVFIYHYCYQQITIIFASMAANKNGLQDTISLLRHKEFRAYMILRFIVIFSLYAQATALSYHIYTLTHNVLNIGYIGLAEIIPAFLFSLHAGYIADKTDKQKMYAVVVIGYLIVAIIIGFLSSSYNTASLPITLLALYVCIFFNGAGRAFLAPVSFSILSMVTPSGKQPQAITLSSTAWYLGSILGPLAGGALLAWQGMQAVSILAIVGLGIACMAVMQITSKPAIVQSTKENVWQSVQQGLQFVFSNQLILACLSLDLFAVLFGGAEALLPVFSKDILQISATGFGWLRSAHGLGSILLTGILTVYPLQHQAGKKLLWSIAGFGACMICFAVSTNFYWSFLFLFVGGMADCVSVVIRQSVLQQQTPTELKGRVASINMLFISSSNELGNVESSIAAKYLGTVPSVIYGGLITFVVVIITAYLAPKLRALQKL
jgi:MFS family permease